MKKLLFNLFTVIILLSSCSKEESSSEITTDNIVPEGWQTAEQTIIINNEKYNLTVAGDPNGEGIKFLNSPKEVEDFFKKYEGTLIPYVLQRENKDVVFYFKDNAEFEKNIEFIDMAQSKALFGGYSYAYEHSSFGYTGGWGEIIQDFMTVFYPLSGQTLSQSGFWNGTISAYGYRQNILPPATKNKISAVLIGHFNFVEPIHYVGYNLDYFSGTKVVISKTSSVNYNTVYLWTLRWGWFQNWNDRINGYETWQSQVNLNTDVEI